MLIMNHLMVHDLFAKIIVIRQQLHDCDGYDDM